MCGHTFTLQPAGARGQAACSTRGELGDLYFISSSRVNLGLHQRDVSVLWDLGPARLLDPPLLARRDARVGRAPSGRDVDRRGIPDVAFVTLSFASGHRSRNVEMSWLAPSKLRRTVLVGSKKMVVYEDGAPEPVRVFDHGVVYRDPETFGEYHLSYRTGDIVSPQLDGSEPLAVELDDFIALDPSRRAPGHEQLDLALDVVRMIEAAETSLLDSGAPVGRDAGRGLSWSREQRRRPLARRWPRPARSRCASPPRRSRARPTSSRRHHAPAARLLPAPGAGGGRHARGRRRRRRRRCSSSPTTPRVWPPLAAPTLPVWLVLFRLYGLYERDVKRVNASALDDLPALFHAFVIGTLLLWVYLKLLDRPRPRRRRGDRLRRLGDAARVAGCGLRPGAPCSTFGGPARVLLVGESAVTARSRAEDQRPPRVRARARRSGLRRRGRRSCRTACPTSVASAISICATS